MSHHTMHTQFIENYLNWEVFDLAENVGQTTWWVVCGEVNCWGGTGCSKKPDFTQMKPLMIKTFFLTTNTTHVMPSSDN